MSHTCLHKLFLAKLDLVLNVNYFSISILYKLIHCFYLYFIKGEKNSYFYLSIGFIFKLVSYSHSLWWKMIFFNWYHTFQLVSCALNEKYFQLVYANIFNFGIKNLKLILFSIWYLYCKMILMFNQKGWFIFFNWYHASF